MRNLINKLLNTMTSNGTENSSGQWKTPDGYVFNDFLHALVHSVEEQGRTSNGSEIEPYNPYHEQWF